MARVTPKEVVTFIEASYPSHVSSSFKQIPLGPGSVCNLETIVTLIEQIPPQLITLQGEQYTRFISGLASLRAEVANVRSTQEHRGRELILLSAFQATPLSLVYHALRQCPENAPLPGTDELPFIDDGGLRQSIRLDISSADKSFAEGEWKAATVLAGSVVEALLSWALSKRTDPPLRRTAIAELKGKFRNLPKLENLEGEDWGLHQYTELAVHCALITNETAMIVRLTKDFRNLIHPGAAARKNMECDRSTASVAIAAIVSVVKDLSRQK